MFRERDAVTDVLYLISDTGHIGGTYLYTFHLFVGKCAGCTSARGTRRRIKPGLYYKRIQIPRTRRAPMPRFVWGGGTKRTSPRKREKDRRNIKNTGWTPWILPRCKPINHSRILFLADKNFDLLPIPFLSFPTILFFVFPLLLSFTLLLVVIKGMFLNLFKRGY